ncbi:hypothetical protein [Arthrobacter pityocampae]|uniref:hypothetical protein n=1 Tax=Arthrobacter pityocampae TaxID=547334 RepID=UPI003734C9D4
MNKVAPKPHAALVLEQIQATAEQFNTSKEARIRVIRLGREAGLTYAQIGDSLGITDAAVIGLLKRAGEFQ